MAGSTGLTRAMGASWWTMGPTHLRRPTITRRRRGATGLGTRTTFVAAGAPMAHTLIVERDHMMTMMPGASQVLVL